MALAVSGPLLLISIAILRQWNPAVASRRPQGPPVPGPIAAASATTEVDASPLDDGGLALAREFTPPIHDGSSLAELREAIGIRGPLGLAVLQAEFAAIRLGPRPGRADIARSADLLARIGLLQMYLGRVGDAATSFQKALSLGRPHDLPDQQRARLQVLLGIVNLHQMEGSPDAEAGTRRAHEASSHFVQALRERPDDPAIGRILELASLRLEASIDHAPDRGAPRDTAAAAGLHANGPRQAGGACFDDYDGDGWPDLLVTSLDVDRGASLYLNRGDGTFRDGSTTAGLEDQVFAASAGHADIDNDGDLDVILVRGADEEPMRLSLLRNRGDGSFEDVTLAAGLGEPISSGAAAWGDYDGDGLVDLFVCGEYRQGPAATPDRRNLCRLYRNRGDGTFRDVAHEAGVENRRRARGAAWGDFDADGRPDLLIANADDAPRLYRNLGDGTFRDLAPALGLAELTSTRNCGFWDADDDGRLDVYLTDDRPGTIAAAGRFRVLRNLGARGFVESSGQAELETPAATLGVALVDVDNDGDLDAYLGSGWPGYTSLIPGGILRNDGRGGFTLEPPPASSFAMRGGCSLALADADGDGRLELFVHGGGMVPGLQARHALWRDASGGGRWLKLRLVGTRSNRSAIGARIRVDTDVAGDRPRSIYRTVTSGSSAGGSSLVQTIGLGTARRVSRVTIHWPAGGDPQVLRDLGTDRHIVITEGKPGDDAVETVTPGKAVRP